MNLKSVEADGTFSGYASLFGEVDLGQDLVMSLIWPGHQIDAEEDGVVAQTFDRDSLVDLTKEAPFTKRTQFLRRGTASTASNSQIRGGVSCFYSGTWATRVWP